MAVRWLLDSFFGDQGKDPNDAAQYIDPQELADYWQPVAPIGE